MFVRLWYLKLEIYGKKKIYKTIDYGEGLVLNLVEQILVFVLQQLVKLFILVNL